MRASFRRTAAAFATAVLMLGTTVAGDVKADPAAEALAKLNDLSRQALEAREAVTAAQRDVDAKVAAQKDADERHRTDVAALDAANAKLVPLQAAANRVATMEYMGGRGSTWAALLTAKSPQQLLDQLSIRHTVGATTADQMKAYRAAREQAASAARTSESSAADARTAAERAGAVRAELQSKWKDLLRQIAAAQAQYDALTPQQQIALDRMAAAPPLPEAAVPPPPAAVPGPVEPPIVAMPGQPPGDVLPPAVDIFEALPVGVANERGLQPNTVLVARAISAKFPQISTMDGVRPDSKPWHPRGLAIDVMIPNSSSPEGIALGDAIVAFVLGNSGRFGIQDAIWRGKYYTPGGPQGSGYGHYDHVHVTTTPRR